MFEFTEKQLARLFPVTSKSHENTETSILLATLMAVEPFRKDILKLLGKTTGTNSITKCYTQVTVGEEHLRPDGCIQVSSSKKDKNPWCALVEVKTGDKVLDFEQVKNYIELAKNHKIGSLLTVSNEFTISPRHNPLDLSKIRQTTLDKVSVYHLSWQQLQTQAEILLAQNQETHNQEPMDEDQVYILQEFIRYINDNDKSFCGFKSMHKDWGSDIDSILNGRKIDCTEMCKSWVQESADMALILGRHCNRPINVKNNHKKDIAPLYEGIQKHIESEKSLWCEINVPYIGHLIIIRVDLSQAKIEYMVSLQANIKRSQIKASVNDAFGFLKNDDDLDIGNVYIEAKYKNKRNNPCEKLLDIFKEPNIIRLNNDPKIVPESYVFKYVVDVNKQTFKSSKKFIERLEKELLFFYDEYAVHLKNWEDKPSCDT